MSIINSCSECLTKQQKIDKLTEEVKSLKAKLKLKERKEKEGFFGSQTPSSQIPVKANTNKENTKKRGAQKGHKGHGRHSFKQSEADKVIEVSPQVGDLCPDCGCRLKDEVKGSRGVIESAPVKAKRVMYLLHEKQCPKCKQIFKSKAPGILPKSLYGNQLISTAAIMHYLHGIPMGRICLGKYKILKKNLMITKKSYPLSAQ